MLDFLLNHTPLLYLTQSVWRDEAFSVFIANNSFSEIIRLTSGDFNPPLYYFLLHFWLTLFGTDEIVLRLLSWVAFLGLCALAYVFTHAVYKNKTLSLIALLLTFTNPMLVYFAFELRMYSLLAFFATASMYFLYTDKPIPYIIFSAAGLYTQPFMAFVFISQALWALATKQFRKWFPYWICIGILFIPWAPTLLTQFSHSGPMWMWPIKPELIFSVLGNMYVGYEGTPAHLWGPISIGSLLIITSTIILLLHKKLRSFNLLIASWVFTPTILVLLISCIKPIYVHRYLIFVTVGELFILIALLGMFKKRALIFSGVLLVFISLALNIFMTPFHRKVDFAQTFAEIEEIKKPEDIILAKNPLSYYESHYYTDTKNSVFLYNPDALTPPRYVGNIGMPESRWKTEYPRAPHRAFLIDADGSYTIGTTL